jgi:hypothetical protein
MKKTIALLLVILLVLPIFAACGNDAANDTGTEAAATGDDAAATEGNAEGDGAAYKIGIMTGTVSQGEEEYRAGQNMVEKYGADVVTHVTYPDKFAQETETTISQVASLASDPAMKAIVITQAVPGTAAAIDKVRETRDDILFILGSPHEDPDAVAKRADICMDVDQLARGYSIMELAKEMGADTFVHYSFPRHMQMQMLAARRDNLKEKAEEIGLAFYEVDAPAGKTIVSAPPESDNPPQVSGLPTHRNTVWLPSPCFLHEMLPDPVPSPDTARIHLPQNQVSSAYCTTPMCQNRVWSTAKKDPDRSFVQPLPFALPLFPPLRRLPQHPKHLPARYQVLPAFLSQPPLL